MGEGIKERIERVRIRIAEAAARVGRDPGGVELVVITKTVPVSRIREAIDSGIAVLGESRVQEAADKIALLS